jgi:Zn-finger protein
MGTYINKDCSYYPCHKVDSMTDCRLCYCPIFPCELKSLGKFIGKGKKRVWDCTNCSIFHKE